jgi:polyhydroxyalkanoate synthesis regulator phasin
MILGALAVIAVVSGGAAYAASKDDSPQARSQAIVNDAAGTLGVDPAKLSDALKQALSNQVDAQVAAGKLTKEQGDAIKQRIADGTQPIFGGPGFGGPRGHFGRFGFGGPGGMRFGFGFDFGGPGLMAGVSDVATYLGLKPAELATQLRSGKSLADIATAQGKTVDGLKTAITDAATKQLDAAVTAGKLSKEQETKLLADLSSHLDDLVNGVHKGIGGPGEMRHGFGFGFGFGGPGLMAGIADVSTYLGLKPAELATQLRSGKSLADIAKAQGKTVDGLKTAITDAATKQLDAAVTAGRLSKEQEAKLLAGLTSHLDELVNDVHAGFGFRHDHEAMPGPNGSWGPDDGAPPPAAPDTAPAPATA